MSRTLPFSLDSLMLRSNRRPAWRVEVYDIRSTSDTISEIIRGVTLQPLTGPLDITSVILDVGIEEVSGDFVSSGVPTTRITFSLVDDTPGNVASRFDPQFSADDPDLPARYFRRGNVFRLFEGDARVDSEDWPRTFTGFLLGQAGVDRNRATDAAGRSLLTMGAASREIEWVGAVVSGEEFGRSTAYLTMGNETAANTMQLDAAEFDFVGWGSQTTGLPIQFIEQSPLVSIAQLMFSDGFLPRFNGDGVLTQTFGDPSQPPARVYLNLDTIRAVVKPFSDLDPVNSVEVIGLEGVKSKVTQQRQPLREVSLTTGYFTNGEEVSVYWSNDRTQLAENIKLQIQKSVNGGISLLGPGEIVQEIPPEGGAPGLSIGAILILSTGHSPYVIVFLTLVYVVLAAIPDTVTTAVFAGVTIPVGRIIQALALAAIMILMSKIGRGQYIFAGSPVEFVYKELRALAEIDGLLTEEINGVTIENHLIQTQADCDAAALLVLARQQARGNPRQVEMLTDLRLEPDDVFEIPGDRRFLIERISRVLTRGEGSGYARYSCSEITAGLEP